MGWVGARNFGLGWVLKKWPMTNSGLVSHWPCVTDNSGITTYGLTALEREMSTPPIPSRSMAHFTPSSINLIPAQAGKVTVGLASHWPCVTDTVVYASTGSTAKKKKKFAPPQTPYPGRRTAKPSLVKIDACNFELSW